MRLGRVRTVWAVGVVKQPPEFKVLLLLFLTKFYCFNVLLRFVLLSLVHEYASHIIVPFSRSLPFQKQEEPASSASIIALLGSPNLKFHHARI